MIESVGRHILKGLTERGGWAEAKEELQRFLGEENSRAAVWKKLQGTRQEGSVMGKSPAK